MIYILNIIKWHLTKLFSGESNIWYPSVTTSVQHFTKLVEIYNCFFVEKSFYVSCF